MGPKQRAGEAVIQIRPRRIAQALGNFAGFAVGLAGLFTEELSDPQRYGLALGALVFACLGARAGWKIQDDARKLSVDRDQIAKEFGELERRFESLSADAVLRSLARPLFAGASGWRLTVYILVEESGEWWLFKRGRVSSTPKWEKSGRQRIQMDKSFVRGLDQYDVSNGHMGQSGELPDFAHVPAEWIDLQQKVLGDRAAANALTMKTRKYAWCAAREQEGQRRVVVLMAESLEPAGISVDVLQSSTMPAMLSMLALLTDMPAQIATAIDQGASALGLPGRQTKSGASSRPL